MPPKLFEKLKCTDCATAMVEKLKANGLSGELLNIRATGGANYIVNDLVGAGTAITENGFHQAVRVGDLVFGNFFPGGVPYQKYIDSLHAPFGVSVTSSPF